MFSSIVIVGRGLIGRSIELAVGERCPDTEVTALDRGDDLAPAATAELVVLAAPVAANNRLLDELRARVGTQTLITDTGSTKASTAAAAAGLRFIGGHPIAGSARGGRDASRADLFEGRPWILTPDSSTAPEDVERLRRFVERLGASVSIVDAAEHDRVFAYLSHLPQLVASALMDVAGTRAGIDALRLAGAGLRDSTRLASSPPDIWLDIVQSNRAHLTGAIDAMIGALAKLRDDETGHALDETFERAALFRLQLEQLQGGK